jgi:hypothetical protein
MTTIWVLLAGLGLVGGAVAVWALGARASRPKPARTEAAPREPSTGGSAPRPARLEPEPVRAPLPRIRLR